MKHIVIAILIVLVVAATATPQSVTLRDTLWLRKATHTDNALAKWDTVFADIKRGDELVASVTMTDAGDAGRWSGFYVPTYSGNFVVEYNAVYTAGDTIIEEQYFSVLDTTAFRGSAAGLGATEIADTLALRGYFRGIGEFACTLEVRDSSLQSGIQGVTVTVMNNDQAGAQAHDETNADGKVWFDLDSLETGNSYKIWLQTLQYTFTFPEPLDLRNDTTAVYYGTAFDYGAPPSDNACAVIGQVFNTQIDSLSGVVVTFTLVVPEDSLIVYNGAIFSRYEVSDTTTADGRFRLDMLPESLFDRPSGMLYYKAEIAYPVDWGGDIVEYDSVSVPEEVSVSAHTILH